MLKVRFLKKVALFYFLVFSNTVHGQIQTGIDISFQSCVKEFKFKNHFIRFNVNNPGLGISYFAKSKILYFNDYISINLGTSLGLSYNHMNHIVANKHDSSYHNSNNITQKNKSSHIGLNYLDNTVFIDFEILKFLIIDIGIQNRLLLYRKFKSDFKIYKGNKYEIENPIPWFYYDLYSGLGIKIGKIVFKYKIFNINKTIFIQDNDDILDINGKPFQPTINTLDKIHIFSLLIPIKNYNTKVQIIKF